MTGKGGARSPEPHPGVWLFVAAFLLSPLVLLAWVGGATMLRLTGWPRWRVAVAALAVGAAVVLVEGGPVPALQNHFAAVLWLLRQYGRPVVHLPLPGAFLLPQVPLSVPAGVLAATLTRPGMALEGPDPAAATRAARRELATRRKARGRVARTVERRTSTAAVLGVSLGGDLEPWQAGRYVVLPEYAARLPRIVIGRPGAGKSVYLAREAFLAGVAGRQLVVLDGKGDHAFTQAVVDAYLAGWGLSLASDNPATVHPFPDEPLSIWQGSPAEQVNKLLGCWAWSLEAQYYRETCTLALRLACGQPGQRVAGMGQLVDRLDPAVLAKAWAKTPTMARLAADLKDQLGGVRIRLANLAAAAAGLLDGDRAVGDADLCVISLPTMANRGDSEAIFRVLMADVLHWAATRKGGRPAQVMVDEFSALDGGRDQAIDLLERGRSAGVPVVLAGQSYRSLGDEDQRDRLVSAADALVLFGSATPDELVRLAGTVLAAEAVYAVDDGAWTGRASVTHRHRAKVEPNTVRQLGVGEAVVVSRGRAARLLVIPAPGSGNGLHASLPPGTLHPDGPAVAVTGRAATRTLRSRVKAKLAALVAAPALTRPLGPGPGRPSPQAGEDSPPDDRQPEREEA
jgi:hypothetical protein